MRWLAGIAAGVALSLAACQPAAPVAAAPAIAESGLALVPLTVSGPSGSHRFTVELARTPADQAKGLMFRRSLAPDRGMVFPFAQPEQATFWMHNTLIPLDLIFIRADGSIANIAANARPLDTSMIPSAGMVTAVLEIPGGRAAELGIQAGDRVDWAR
ncbi:MAG: DUF192 domain-containing protein [Sphingomicrobium sp.]